MRTLADMTEEERTECVGLWCVYETPVGEERAIYEKTQAGAPVSILFEPGYGRFEAENENIALCFNLPRAWAPNGTPPAGEWEEAEYLGNYKGMTNVYHFDGDPTHRRWVGDWEQA